MCFFSVMIGLITVDCFKTFGFTRENLDHEAYLTWVVSISCIFNAMRSVWSILLDHHSYKKVMGALLII